MTAIPVRQAGARAMQLVAWLGLAYGVLWFVRTAQAAAVPHAVYAAAPGWAWPSPETVAAYAPAIGTILGNAIYIYWHKRHPAKKPQRPRKPRPKPDAPKAG